MREPTAQVKITYEKATGGTEEKVAPMDSVKLDSIGLTFYDIQVMMLLTITWDKIASFKVEGSTDDNVRMASKRIQANRSDARKPKGMNTTV